MIRWSRTFLPTLRENPSEAESASHRLMLRAGLVRQLSAGVYSYLPLGLRALRKAENIVREEMNRAGAVELLMPALHPPELWRETGRYDAFGDTLMKVRDRKGAEHVLGPTHEEIITHLVRNEVTSHRQLPVTLYQIQGKFRDEARPRFGVVRTREFIMKDAYSFDIDERGMARSYQAMYDAYVRIFTRAGLPFLPVEAETGLMGGDVSHEFISPSESGEDVVLTCPKCGYAANREKAEIVPTEGTQSWTGAETQELLVVEEVSTPGLKTVEEVATFLKTSPRGLVKTLIFETDRGPLAALLRGDHEVNLSKLARAAQVASLEMASPETIQKVTGGPLGFSGPVGLNVRMIADHGITTMLNFVTGANRKDAHLRYVNWNRDFKAEKVADIRVAAAGDPCPKCRIALQARNGIEIGHVFKLGTRYSLKMKAMFQDDEGKGRPVVMGCYGIGVNRIVAAAVENRHDEAGIVWPKELAPHQVLVVSVNPSDLRIDAASHRVIEDLEKAGWDVLWDDRDQPAGVKFADADLVGIPVRVTVGSRTVKSETVDVKTRVEKEQKTVPLAQAAEAVREAWGRMPF